MGGGVVVKKILVGVVALLLLLTVYLSVWPVPVKARVWQAPPAPGYAGPHVMNQRLAGLQHIALNGEEGPEHVVLARDGWLYAAMASGRILRMRPDGSGQQVFVDTGGRPLGFDFDAQGRMLIADGMKGLLMATPDGRLSLLTNHVSGAEAQAAADPIVYADAVVVAPDGLVYLSDASTRFSPARWGGTFEASVLDILEQSATGRVLVFDPTSGRTQVVAHGLSFANGVALSADGRSLFVNETGQYRVWKLDTAARGLDLRPFVAQPGPQARVLLANLPGYPDNLMRGLDGRLWLGLAKPRNPVIDGLAGKPWMRELTLRLPRALWPVPPAYGHVIAFNEDGQVLADLQDPTGAYPETTAITETPERLYVQSLHAKTLGWLPRSALPR
jgi:sugar lactone lactonase YvrE